METNQSTLLKTYRHSFWFLLIITLLFLLEVGVGASLIFKNGILKTCLLVINPFKRVFNLSTFHIITSIVFFLLAGSFLYAIIKAACSIYRVRQIRQSIMLNKVEPLSILSGSSIGFHDVETRHIRVIRDPRSFAFTIGFLSTSIIVSTSLLDMMEEPERIALLIHEDAHRKNKDPLRQLIVNFIADALWYIPWVNKLKKVFFISKEIVADEEVLAKGSQPFLLGKTILKMAKEKIDFSHDPLPAFFSFSSAEIRIERIMGKTKGPLQAGTATNLLLSLMACFASFIATVPICVLTELFSTYIKFPIAMLCL